MLPAHQVTVSVKLVDCTITPFTTAEVTMVIVPEVVPDSSFTFGALLPRSKVGPVELIVAILEGLKGVLAAPFTNNPGPLLIVKVTVAAELSVIFVFVKSRKLTARVVG